MKMKNNIEEELVTFETAKLTKEKGFPIIEKGFYIEGVFTNRGFSKDFHRWYKDDPLIQSAPTQSLLQKWLREVHNIKLCISWTETDNWLYEINHKQEGISGYNTYEEALEKGLFQALKLIENE